MYDICTYYIIYYIFVFILSSGVYIYIQYFCDAMRNQTSNKVKRLIELIKKRSKVHEKNMSRASALNFTNDKYFFENYESIRV